MFESMGESLNHSGTLHRRYCHALGCWFAFLLANLTEVYYGSLPSMVTMHNGQSASHKDNHYGKCNRNHYVHQSFHHVPGQICDFWILEVN